MSASSFTATNWLVERRWILAGLLAVLMGSLAAILGPNAAVAVAVGVVAAYFTLARPGLLLAAYVLIPFYKGALQPYLPFDLTVGLAILNIAQILILVRSRPAIRFSPSVMWLWTAIAGLILIGPLYARDQTLALETTAYWWALEFLPLFAVFRVAADSRAVRDLVAGLFTLGVLVVVLALPEVFGSSRLAVLGANTIGVGRAALLVPLIGIAVVMRSGPMWLRYITLPLIPAAILVELGSGSRGPLFALIAVAILVELRRAASGHVPSRRTIGTGIVGVLGVVALGLIALPYLPDLATVRFGLFADFITSGLAGDFNLVGDTSAGTRITLFGLAGEMFVQAPILGHGTASYEAFAASHLSALEFEAYPHNTLLQFAAEFGVVGLILSTTLLAVALVRPTPTTHVWTAVRLVFVFFLLNAMVSGDIYGDRMLWALALLLAAAPRADRPPVAQVNGSSP